MIPAQEIVELALRAAAASGRCDETVVIVTERSDASLRWAGNSMTTNGVATSRSVAVISVVRKGGTAHVGAVRSSAVSEESVGELVAAAERAAHAESDRQHHPSQRLRVAVEDDAEPRRDHADAEVLGGLRLRLPVRREFGEEPATAGVALDQPIVATIAIEPDRRRRHEDTGAPLHRRHRVDEETGGIDPAVAEQALATLRPAAVADGRTGEVHDGITAIERAVVDGAVRGVPRGVIRGDIPAGAA